MKTLRNVISLALLGAALTVVPAIQQAASGEAPVVRDKSLVQKVQEGARGSVKVSTSRATGQASSMRAGLDGDLFPSDTRGPKAKSEAFLTKYAKAFGAPRGQLVRTQVRKDRIGSTTLTYVQRYRGIPVFGATLRVHVDKQDDLTSVNGALVPVRNLSLARTVNARQAAARAVALVRAQPPGVDGKHVGVKGLKAVSARLVVYRQGLIQGRANGANQLAYQIEVTNGRSVRDVVYVSALGGKVVNRYSLMDDALYRILYEASLKPNGTIAFKKVWEEGDRYPGRLNVDERNMVDSTGEAYWLFQNAFGRDSYDAAGHTMTTVNNDPRISCPNANWNGATTNYCDGVSSDDVVAHEWGHAYTQYTSGLIYQWQPGAMNEAYSDIWGETVDLINGRQDEGEGDIATPRPVGLCSTHSGALPLLTINSPSAIAKDCLTGGASFGQPLTATGITGDVVAPTSSDATQGLPKEGCSAYDQTVTGLIVLVDRGSCSFEQKAQVATAAGAAALIIGNRDEATIGMSGADTTLVSTVSIGLTDRESIRTALTAAQTVNVTMKDAGGDRYDSYRWLIGEKSLAFGGAIRDMWNPTCYGDPGKVTDVEYKCSTDDNGGVHGNSGVVNHAYSLLVDGGTFNAHTVAGIGLDKAANIYWRAQTEYLTETSGFPELADALEASCIDLVGQPIKQLSTAVNDSTAATELITAADCTQVTAAAAAVELRTDPTDQCGWEPQLKQGAAALCGTGFTPTTVFSEDFEDGLTGWTQSGSNPYGGSTFPWTTTMDYEGTHTTQVAKGDDPAAGDCSATPTDASSVDYLASGNIVIPASASAPRMSFQHYIATEQGFDGGNVQLSVNGGPFAPIGTTAYTFNPPTNLSTVADGSTNPLAGQVGFTGTDPGSVFGSWGESQVDLAAAGVTPGDTIALSFAMGRDGCSGVDGWYVDNISVVTCAASGPSQSQTVSPTVTPTVTPSSTTTGNPNKGTVTLSVTHVPQPSRYGTSSAVQVVVNGSGAIPTGTVTLSDSTGTIGTGTLAGGAVSISLPAKYAVGIHTLTATYGGSATYNGGTTTVVTTVRKALTTTKLTLKPSAVGAGEKVVAKIRVKAAGIVPKGRVKLFDNGELVAKGKLVAGVVKLKLTDGLSSGLHKLKAKYVGSKVAKPSNGKLKTTV